MGDDGVRATLHHWEDLPKEQLSETIDRRLVTGRSVMLAHVYLKKGAIVPRHQHENEQYTYVLQLAWGSCAYGPVPRETSRSTQSDRATSW